MKNHILSRLPELSFRAILFQVLLFLLTYQPASGQSMKKWQWIKQIGGKSWDISAGVVCNSKNHLFLGGSFIDTLRCDSKKVKSSGIQDIFVARFNDKGKLDEINYGGGSGDDHINCISETTGENVIIGGVLSDSATFGKILTSGTGKRLFISEVDDRLDFNWVTTIKIKGEASLFLLGSDQIGNIFFAGDFKGSIEAENQTLNTKGKRDIFLGRLNRSGKIEQLISIGGEEDDYPSAMAVDSSGKVILAGTFGKAFETDKVNFNTGPKGTSSNSFIILLSKDLSKDWVNFYYNQGYVDISSLKFDNIGNFYASGSYDMNFNLSDTNLISHGYTDGFLLKYKSDSRFLWARSFGSWYYDDVSQVNVDNTRGAMISGSLGGPLVIDSLYFQPEAENNNSFILQFSEIGKAVWGECLSGKGRNFSQGSHLDKKGSLYFTGSFKDELKVDGIAFKSFGDQDIFLAKFHNCPELDAVIAGEPSFCPGSEAELSVKNTFSNVVWNDSIYNKYKINVQIPGLNWVKMLDKYGCVLEDTINVNQNPLPGFTLGRDTIISISDSLLLRSPDYYVSYNWQDNSTLPEFLARSVNHTPETIDYWLKVTDSLSCTNSDTISITFVKGLYDNKIIELVVYPNPADDWFYWLIKAEEADKLKAEIIDINGRVLYQELNKNHSQGQENQVYIHNLAAGPYNFQISDRSTGKVYKSVRLIKK